MRPEAFPAQSGCALLLVCGSHLALSCTFFWPQGGEKKPETAFLAISAGGILKVDDTKDRPVSGRCGISAEL